MPIKFRCHHCRQFLGISRGMAEKVVDCPSCGRTIRVPDLDGRVAPLPQPKLDLADSSLRDALDRLASIGSVPGLVLADSESPSDESHEVSDDTFAPVALEAPKPVPVPAAAASKPVVAEPISPDAGAAPRADYGQGDPLASLARSDPKLPATGSAAAGVSPTMMILVAAGIGLVGAVAGVAAARLLFPAGGAANVAAGDPDAKPSPGDDSEVLPAGTAIAGRITYRTEAGDKADAGARILALPDERTGTAKIGIEGLRPGDSKTDFRVARAAINALGGDAAVIGADGTFTLVLPSAGTYQVVVLSHYQAREDGESLPAAVEQILAKYLDRPTQLVGDGQVEFARVLWKGVGNDPVSWSHTFSAADS